MTSLGLQPFLRYPAQLKVTYQSRRFHFDTPSDAENFLQNTFQRSSILQRNSTSLLQEQDEMDASSPQWAVALQSEISLVPYKLVIYWHSFFAIVIASVSAI